VVTLVAMDVTVLVTLRSPRSKILSIVLAFRGMKRVQNKAIRIPRSITRCFRMKRTDEEEEDETSHDEEFVHPVRLLKGGYELF
jgi:predicted NUDIX family phosphoesterase